jgi:hypothetical protein
MILMGEERGVGAAMEVIERNARTNVKGLMKRMLVVDAASGRWFSVQALTLGLYIQAPCGS